MKFQLLPLVGIALLAGCSPSPAPVADHRAEALQAIRAAEEAVIQAFGKRDGDLSASFYAPDATLAMANMPLVKSADIRPLLKEMMADPNFTMSFRTAKVEAPASGEMGYTRGTYSLTMTDPKSKKIVREVGKYVTTYAKQPDGSWKIVDDISNRDAPAAPVEAK